jgi:fructose-1-phosphate kinase PfkB-like protein
MHTLIFGLNPALQKILEFDSLEINNVNRAAKAECFASGKGVNCIRVLSRLGGNGILVHFTGGDSGRRISSELTALGIESINQEIHEETRTCTTLIANGRSTELIEPSPRVTEDEKDKLLEQLVPLLGHTDLVVFCGTFPGGIDGSFFSFLQKLPSSCRILLDGVKEVEPVLEQGVSLLKVNRDEMKELTGRDDFLTSCSSLRERYSIENIVMTDGSRPVGAALGTDIHSVEMPDIGKPVNVIGAGDAFLAGWIYAQRREISDIHSLLYASAVSLARCRVMLPWDMDTQDVERFYSLLKS